MPSSLLPSQFATLEPLAADEPGVTVSVAGLRPDVLALPAVAARRTAPPRRDESDGDHRRRKRPAHPAALLGIAVVVVLIAWLKVHPFLALILGSAVLGVVAGVAPRRHRHELHDRGRRHGRQSWAC